MMVVVIVAVLVVWLFARMRRKARQRRAVTGLAEAITPTVGEPSRLPSPRFWGSRGAM